MKIVLWSDVHLEHSVRSDNIEGERQSVLVLDVLERHLIAERPDWVVINGDLLDKHGIIESSLAVLIKERIVSIARNYNVGFVFITGNHEYPEVKKEYFGKGLLTALFAGLEKEKIHVVDAAAKFIRLDETHVVLGIPYRETWEQYKESCHEPILAALAASEIDLSRDKVIIGWHVGLPWGQAWRGDEEENSWIHERHEAVILLFSLAYGKQIYLGHYHGPAETACGDLGTFVYIGSPATRTRAESGQIKRVGVWSDGDLSFYETRLELDKITTSIAEAIAHKDNLVQNFGEGVLQIASIHVNLGEDASRDDFNVAKVNVLKWPCITVIPPKPNKKSLCDHIIEKHRNDPNSSREQLEKDIFQFSVKNYYKNKIFKGISEESLDLLLRISSKSWKKAAKDGRDTDISELKDKLISLGMKEDLIPPLSKEFCQQASDFALTVELSGQMIIRN